jgi:hypothetical protein
MLKEQDRAPHLWGVFSMEKKKEIQNLHFKNIIGNKRIKQENIIDEILQM